MQPLVSVIIPAYNHEKFIGAAIDSVLEQTVADLELIVIDDGSSDSTGAIVKEYKDTRLSYYYQKNRDAYNTINRGMSLAKGRYIAILNSDDIYALDRLEQLLLCHKQTHAPCIITDVVPISAEGRQYTNPEFGWNLWHQKNRAYYHECGDIYMAFLKGNLMVTTSNIFMTTQAMKKVGDFCSLRYLHDYDYIFRMMLAFPGELQYQSDQKLLYYRIHSGNTLGEAAVVGREQDQQIIGKYMAARVPEKHQKYIVAGSERLLELGSELHEVRTVLQPQRLIGVRSALKILSHNLRHWFWKKIRNNIHKNKE